MKNNLIFKMGFIIIFSLLIVTIGTFNVSALNCSNVTLKYKSSGECVKQAQKLLNTRGFYKMSIDGKYGVGTTNAVLNYQRARHITDDGVVGINTWKALNSSYMPTNPIPNNCKNKGTVICVSKAERKLRMYNSGTLIKTLNIRVGGFTTDINGNYRVHQTVEGTYTVFKKDPNPYSKRYGAGAMPWSVMFDRNMYVHYSEGFSKDGYNGASHGCVNVGNLADAEWVYKNTQIGSKVIVY